jgi:hypothetical protein
LGALDARLRGIALYLVAETGGVSGDVVQVDRALQGMSEGRDEPVA